MAERLVSFLICFLKNAEIIFKMALLHSHYQCMSDPIFLQSLCYLLVSLFSTLTTLKVYSNISLWIFLICISLIANCVEHLFICLFESICLLQWDLYVFFHILVGLFGFLLLDFEFFKYFLGTSSLSHLRCVNIFSQLLLV